MIYTEIILKKENAILNNIIKAGQPTALKDLISYEEVSIANVDLVHADNMKFCLLYTSLRPAVLRTWKHAQLPQKRNASKLRRFPGSLHGRQRLSLIHI